jgi:hypothetical protein
MPFAIEELLDELTSVRVRIAPYRAITGTQTSIHCEIACIYAGLRTVPQSTFNCLEVFVNGI